MAEGRPAAASSIGFALLAAALLALLANACMHLPQFVSLTARLALTAAFAAALCLMAGTGAFAQEAKPAAAPKERPTVEQMAQRMTERMQKELKLTDAQAKEVFNLNFQQIKEMQAMREKMREARKAEAEKMKSILTTEQFVQWSQMQAPRPGQRGHGPQMMKKGDRRGGGKECCDKPCPKKDKKGKE